MKIDELTNIQGIYKINFPNGKFYIGMANQIRTRIKQHINKDYKEHPELPIARAINLYGIQDVEILEECPNLSREELTEREKYWIKLYNATNLEIGYNISPGGDGADFGWLNQQAKLSETQLFELYDYLQNSNKTFEQLAEIYGVNIATIGRINNGVHYHQPGYKYPLRSVRIERYGLENKHDAFYGKENELQSLIDDIQHTTIPLKELMIKYGIGQTTISLINQGKKYYDPSKTYPLRNTKSVATKRIFTNDEMLKIKDMLEDSNISMAEIAKLFKCDRKVISDINHGNRQPNDNWIYPLRMTPMKTGPKSK